MSTLTAVNCMQVTYIHKTSHDVPCFPNCCWKKAINKHCLIL